MDITGARWGLPGAEAILKLRALRSNGDFDDYWHYHLTQERHRVHESRYPNGRHPTGRVSHSRRAAPGFNLPDATAVDKIMSRSRMFPCGAWTAPRWRRRMVGSGAGAVGLPDVRSRGLMSRRFPARPFHFGVRGQRAPFPVPARRVK